MSNLPTTPLERLIRQIATLPGLGTRSARRIALHLLDDNQHKLHQMVDTLNNAAESIKICSQCGNIDHADPCPICMNEKRSDIGTLCILSGVSDLWAMERTGLFRGHYHVLGGVLSALSGIGPDDLRLDSLITRLKSGQYTEIILALSATVDGQTTGHYIIDALKKHDLNIKITRLAHGLPMGGELDYLDDGTLMTALNARAAVE